VENPPIGGPTKKTPKKKAGGGTPPKRKKTGKLPRGGAPTKGGPPLGGGSAGDPPGGAQKAPYKTKVRAEGNKQLLLSISSPRAGEISHNACVKAQPRTFLLRKKHSPRGSAPTKKSLSPNSETASPAQKDPHSPTYEQIFFFF